VKVRELIEKLQEFDPELEVLGLDYMNGAVPVESVTLMPKVVRPRVFEEAHVLIDLE
jgi:hypothetical protein